MLLGSRRRMQACIFAAPGYLRPLDLVGSTFYKVFCRPACPAEEARLRGWGSLRNVLPPPARFSRSRDPNHRRR